MHHHKSTSRAGVLAMAMALFVNLAQVKGETPSSEANTVAAETRQSTQKFYIREFRVKGGRHLTPLEIEEAVYPFSGPGRSEADVENARARLENAFHDKGYQTVSVVVPQQSTVSGIIRLQVIEREVARLRVKGARYSSPEKIRAGAPSLAEGTVINFNDVPRDIVALNQIPGRQITPALKPGLRPETVDVELDVKDQFPIHGNLELNNRYGPDTEPLRVNGGITDNNLWQRGHTLGFNFQLSPQDTSQVKVFSGYYLVRTPSLPKVGFLAQGTVQNSNVSTLGNTAVFGHGQNIGAKAIFSITTTPEFYDSASFGFDYKHNRQRIHLGGTSDGLSDIYAPVTYFPLSASFTANWTGKKSSTEFNADVVFHLRGMGSGNLDFDNRRFGADGSFIYLRADLSHSHQLWGGLQIFGKVQGQIADRPLLDPEQFTGGGLGTVRGYLEAETAADNGVAGTLELRSPSILELSGMKEKGEWRLYAFGDGAALRVIDPLAEQKDHYYLASYGVGTRFQMFEHYSGSVDAARAMYKQSKTGEGDWRLTFRAGVDF